MSGYSYLAIFLLMVASYVVGFLMGKKHGLKIGEFGKRISDTLKGP